MKLKLQGNYNKRYLSVKIRSDYSGSWQLEKKVDINKLLE